MRPFLFLFLATSSLFAQVAPVPAPAELQVMRAEPVRERELITRLQIYLDQRNFGPGKIDGRWGEFTGKALNRYQKASGMNVDGKWESIPDLLQISPIYTSYTLRPEDFKQVGEIPKTPQLQAKLKRMPYTNILEFLGEKFHSDPEFLLKLNKDRSMAALVAGDVIRVPNVAPFLIEDMKEIGSLPPVPEFATRSIHIDTVNKMLELRDGDKLLAAFPITPGAANHPAPKGTWHIVGIATMPWYRWNKGVLNNGVPTGESYEIPAGPNCPVGVLWCGLNKRGVGVHGTNSPDNIGRTGSHGCIRLANWDAARFASMVTKGMTVLIDAVDVAPTVPATPTPSPVASATPAQ
ncbi:MAG: L,D-transpeptidase family protein [Chthoniobacterales bacterium]